MIDSDKKISKILRLPSVEILAATLLALTGISASGAVNDQVRLSPQEPDVTSETESVIEINSTLSNIVDIDGDTPLDTLTNKSEIDFASSSTPPADADTTGGAMIEAAVLEFVDFTVNIHGIKKLNDSYLHLKLTSSAGNKTVVLRREVNTEGNTEGNTEENTVIFKDCSSEKERPKCGKTKIKFERTQSDIDYLLMVCHTVFPSSDSCRIGDDGEFISATAIRPVVPSHTQDTYTLSLGEAY